MTLTHQTHKPQRLFGCVLPVIFLHWGGSTTTQQALHPHMALKEMVMGFLPKAFHPPVQSGEVVGRYYKRFGACNMCGKCCTNIYLVHNNETIKTAEEFAKLQAIEREYQGFTPLEADEHGLRVACKHLRDDQSCEIYEDRPSFCRKYPSETGILLGAELATGCGYTFELLKTFDDVLAEEIEVSKSQVILAEKLE